MLANYFRNRIFLYIALIVFVIAKVPHLFYAFYWDESWVYAPAIYEMHTHGPSLLPGGVSLDFSRGHPMLYQATCAVWMSVFGKTNFSMHCFALAVSVALVIAVYEALLKIFNKRAAIVGLLLLLTCMEFYVSAAFLLTDVALALLVTISYYAYTTRRYVLMGASMAALFYTKESGFVALVPLGIDTLLRMVTGKDTLKETLAKCIALAFSLVAIGVFFIVQKNTYGWYLYPAHTGIINFGIETTLFNLVRSLKVLFYSYHIWYFYLLFALLATMVAIKTKRWKYLLMLIPLAAVYASFLSSYKDGLFYFFAGVLVIAFFVSLFRPLPMFSVLQAHFVKLLAAFSVCYIYFCGINFYEERYVFPALVAVSVIFLAIAIERLINHLPEQAFRYVVPALVVTGLAVYFSSNADNYFDRMDVQQNLVDYFEKNNFYDKNICAPAFLEYKHLTDHKTGFLHSSRQFGKVYDSIDTHTELAVFDNIEFNDQYYGVRANSSFYLLHRFQKGNEWVEVYRRR